MQRNKSPSIVYNDSGIHVNSDVSSGSSLGMEETGSGTGFSGNLNVPIIRSGNNSRNSSTERKRESISDQLKGALSVPKSASSSDLPTIVGRKPLSKALQPKDSSARRPSYQPIISGPFAYSTSSGLTGAAGKDSLQQRRSSVSVCYPTRTIGVKDAEIRKPETILCKTAEEAINRKLQDRRVSDAIPSGISTRFSRNRKPDVSQDSIYPLLSYALEKKTPSMDEESSQKVVMRNAGRQSPAIRKTSRPNSFVESSPSRVSEDGKSPSLIQHQQTFPLKTFGYKLDVVHASARPDARPESEDESEHLPHGNKQRSETIPSVECRTQRRDFSESGFDLSSSRRTNDEPTFTVKTEISLARGGIASTITSAEAEKSRIQIKNTSPTESQAYAQLTSFLPSPFKSVSINQDEWYDPIPVTPRKSIRSPSSRLSVGSCHEEHPEVTFSKSEEPATPYSGYSTQPSISTEDNDDAFETSTPSQHKNMFQKPEILPETLPSQKADEEIPPPLPPLPSSLPPLMFPELENDFPESLENKASSLTIQHIHQQTDSFNTEDSGLDRSDCNTVENNFDDLNERKDPRNCFSSREDLYSEGRGSLMSSPHPNDQIRGLTSPTNSDADSGIDYTKMESRRGDITREDFQTSVACENEDKILFRLLSENSSSNTKDWFQIVKDQTESENKNENKIETLHKIEEANTIETENKHEIESKIETENTINTKFETQYKTKCETEINIAPQTFSTECASTFEKQIKSAVRCDINDIETSKCNGIAAIASASGVMNVELEKGNLGIGFCIEGGKGSSLGDRPVLIKRLFRGDIVKTGTLQVGDEILSVNGKSFSDLSHYEAWNYIKSVPNGIISLAIRRK